MLIAAPFPAAAAREAIPMKPAIAAIVGSEAISSYDVENRLKFVIVSSNLPDKADVIDRLRGQVIRTLIDEKLEWRDALANNITVSDEELAQAIKTIEKDRDIPPGGIFGLLEKHRLPKETFSQQIRVQLAWRKLMIKKLRPLVQVTEEEVELARLSPSASSAPQELKIAVLTLPVDKPSQEKEVQATIQKLAKELRGGASFEEVTRQLTGQSARSNGADAFWVRPEQLDPMMARALSGASANSISEPVRTGTGYTIVKIYETRSTKGKTEPDAEVSLKEILLKLKPDAEQHEANLLLGISEEVAKNPGTCEEKGVAGIGDIDGVDIDVRMTRVRLSELPRAVRTITEALKPGHISAPFASSEGIRLFMLCERRDVPLSDAEKEQIHNQIYQQKMELEAQKYLRDLRRDTFIEIRT